MAYPSFGEHMHAAFGDNWCVAARSSVATIRKGQKVVTPKRYAEEKERWARQHPAWIMADSLPDDDAGQFVRKAVILRLSGREG